MCIRDSYFFLPLFFLTILLPVILKSSLARWSSKVPFMDGQTSNWEKYHGNITGQQKIRIHLYLLRSVTAQETAFYFLAAFTAMNCRQSISCSNLPIT